MNDGSELYTSVGDVNNHTCNQELKHRCLAYLINIRKVGSLSRQPHKIEGVFKYLGLFYNAFGGE